MYTPETEYDVIVVGSGHAGVEAALAAAKLGSRTLLLTQNLDTISQMSCNPAIGGSAKGHLVREIDALGGAMGINADATGIQFRLLNRSKGPSVRSPRAQCDKKAYQFRMKFVVETASALNVKQATVSRLVLDHRKVRGVETDIGVVFRATCVIITAGTFLRGLLHIGRNSKPGGRMADSSSTLSQNLRELGFVVGRFKTGTPCRIGRRSIDFSQCKLQAGDERPTRFSFIPIRRQDSDLFTLNYCRGDAFHVEQMPCWITRTTPETHRIIAANLSRSALYSGRIEGIGPRYCPSIEDKVVKFADRNHQIFLEPEGRQTEEFYVNGVSTSLPYDVQVAFLRTIPGLANVEIVRPGYAVEYDYFPPTQLQATLETKLVQGLYFAGQVNVTSGYEDAAAQGLIAGINAGLKMRGESPFVLSRSEAYVGVLIDDLITRGTDEPYRMFTSRAEDRLTLRHDNADQRLTPRGFDIGLVDAQRWNIFSEKRASLEKLRAVALGEKIGGAPIWQRMKDTHFSVADLPEHLLCEGTADLWEAISTDAKSEGYVWRQTQQNARALNRRDQVIPAETDYTQIVGLRHETREKLGRLQPATIEAASNVSGITPTDLRIISIWLEKSSLHRNESGASSRN